ncbi:MAG: cytochrome c [Gammaproteobacteria bacterium]|nr:MAG: cytochrome c [Gammaproteobacteria bacterium]
MKNGILGITKIVTCLLVISCYSAMAAEPEMPGKKVFNKWCIHCHAAGNDYPGTWKLSLRLGKEKSVLAERKDLNSEYIKYIVRNGFGGMPLFRRIEISDDELNALTNYLVKQ